MASQTVKKAAGLLIYRRIANEIQFLMLQASHLHHWTPPKGHLDPGETEMEAALRETQEEAGLDKNQINIIESYKAVLHYEVRGKPKEVTYWLGELKDADTTVTLSHEHKDYKWLNLTEALEYNAMFEDMKKVLKEANDFIQRSTT